MQPVPALFYNINYNETLTRLRSKYYKELFYIGYNDVIYNINSEYHPYVEVHDANKILTQYKDGIPYVDSTHYAPRAIKIISKYIIKSIKLK